MNEDQLDVQRKLSILCSLKRQGILPKAIVISPQVDPAFTDSDRHRLSAANLAWSMHIYTQLVHQ